MTKRKATANDKTLTVALLARNQELLEGKTIEAIHKFVHQDGHGIGHVPASTLKQQCNTLGITYTRNNARRQPTVARGEVQRDIIRKMARIIRDHIHGVAVSEADSNWLNAVAKGKSHRELMGDDSE